MYKEIAVKGTALLEVQVDPIDSLYGIKNMLGFGNRFDDVSIYHGAIQKCFDVSHHSSPDWEYTLISDKQEDIDAFNAINLLIQYCENKLYSTKKMEDIIDKLNAFPSCGHASPDELKKVASNIYVTEEVEING